MVPIGPPGDDRAATIAIGGEDVGELGLVAAPAPAPEVTELAGSSPDPLVVIAMATYEPDPALLRRQLDSIREQTHGRWLCVISDDGSSEQGRAEIEAAVGGDRRFVLSPAPRRSGVYANFERALSLVPPAAEFVALADQDDVWRPDKLDASLEALGDGALLAFSDMRIVDREGAEISPTYWTRGRRPALDLESLVLANQVTGAASVFRRELLNDALPFPPEHGRSMHDHWLAQTALAFGSVAWIPRPLLDYVQHPGAALGHAAANAGGRWDSGLGRRALGWARLATSGRGGDWRRVYFEQYCRLVQTSQVLMLRGGGRLGEDDARTLVRFADPAATARRLIRRIGAGRSAATLGREQALLAGLAWWRARGL